MGFYGFFSIFPDSNFMSDIALPMQIKNMIRPILVLLWTGTSQPKQTGTGRPQDVVYRLIFQIRILSTCLDKVDNYQKSRIQPEQLMCRQQMVHFNLQKQSSIYVLKIAALKNFANFIGEQQSCFAIVLKTCTFVKKSLQRRCFSVKLAFFKNTFF